MVLNMNNIEIKLIFKHSLVKVFEMQQFLAFIRKPHINRKPKDLTKIKM